MLAEIELELIENGCRNINVEAHEISTPHIGGYKV